MAIINSILSWVMKKRIHEVELFMKYPVEVQNEWFDKLLRQARDTEYGKKYDFRSISSQEEYRNRVPIVSYEELYPHGCIAFYKGSKIFCGPAKFVGLPSPQELPMPRVSLSRFHLKHWTIVISKAARTYYLFISTTIPIPNYSMEKVWP